MPPVWRSAPTAPWSTTSAAARSSAQHALRRRVSAARLVDGAPRGRCPGVQFAVESGLRLRPRAGLRAELADARHRSVADGGRAARRTRSRSCWSSTRTDGPDEIHEQVVAAGRRPRRSSPTPATCCSRSAAPGSARPRRSRRSAPSTGVGPADVDRLRRHAQRRADAALGRATASPSPTPIRAGARRRRRGHRLQRRRRRGQVLERLFAPDAAALGWSTPFPALARDPSRMTSARRRSRPQKIAHATWECGSVRHFRRCGRSFCGWGQAPAGPRRPGRWAGDRA